VPGWLVHIAKNKPQRRILYRRKAFREDTGTDESTAQRKPTRRRHTHHTAATPSPGPGAGTRKRSPALLTIRVASRTSSCRFH
jgi:hypothetical protein